LFCAANGGNSCRCHFVFWARLYIREKRLFASFPSLCPHHQRDTHLTDFREIRYWGFSRKNSVEKIQIWLKSGKNIGHLREDYVSFTVAGVINSP
jgi:hypothetical protein